MRSSKNKCAFLISPLSDFECVLDTAVGQKNKTSDFSRSFFWAFLSDMVARNRSFSVAFRSLKSFFFVQGCRLARSNRFKRAFLGVFAVFERARFKRWPGPI